MILATWNVPPAVHAGSRAARPQPDEVVHLVRVGGARVRGAVLEPHQVARRAGGARRALEAVDTPARLHRAARVLGQVAKGVEHVVGAVGADLDAEIAAALGRVEVVVREARHLGQAGRAQTRESEAIVEEAAPHPEHECDLLRRQLRSEHAVVVGRRGRPEVLRRPAGIQRPHALRDRAQQRLQLRFRPGDHVEGDERGRRGRLAQDRRLVRPLERGQLSLLGRRRGCAVGESVRSGKAARRGDRAEARRRAETEEAAAREAAGAAVSQRRLRKEPAGADPGSARASRAGCSSRR